MKFRIVPLTLTFLLLSAPFLAAQDVFTGRSVRIVNPGAPLNSDTLDYAPTISPDGKTIYFVSSRTGSKKTLRSGARSHDFWFSTKQNRLDTIFSEPVSMDSIITSANNGLNTSRNEGVPSIAANRRTMYFTGCDRPDVIRRKKPLNGEKIEDEDCDIYVVDLNENGEWGIPRNLGLAVNSEWWDGQPSISPDGLRLYFASNRPGGYGLADIWYSDFDQARKIWLAPKNAGNTINTPGFDWSPFIAANNRELFFSSDWHQIKTVGHCRAILGSPSTLPPKKHSSVRPLHATFSTLLRSARIFRIFEAHTIFSWLLCRKARCRWQFRFRDECWTAARC
jgi:WD40-like Beta Propeller Repeat